MPLICPNTNHPDWQALVSKYGEDAAWKLYFENDQKIPNPDISKKADKIKIKASHSAMGTSYDSKSTMDHMDKHPEVVSGMMDDLAKHYPNVRIAKDKVIAQDGTTWVVPKDKKGVHIKSAIVSAIAYGNDAYVETIPHEYAHEYVDMFENAPIVQEGIKMYGSKEKLVTMIGRKYAGQKMSKSYDSWNTRFWNWLKGIFRGKPLLDRLTDSFAKNEYLGDPAIVKGTNVNYQSSVKPMVKDYSAADFNENMAEASETVKYKSIEQTNKEVKDDFIKSNVITKEKFDNVINLTKSFLTNNFAKPLADYVSDISESLIKLKDSQYINTIKERLAPYNKPELNSISREEALSIIEGIIADKENFKLDDSQTYYQGKGKKWIRQSSYTNEVRNQDKSLPNEDMGMGATVGNLIDIIGRDIFDGKLRQYQDYLRQANEMSKDNGYEVTLTPEQFQIIVDEVNKVKADFDANDIQVVPYDVFVYREFTPEEKERFGDDVDGVAGTLDLVGVDKDGNIHIVDFKNRVYSGQSAESIQEAFYSTENPWTNQTEKWADQQTTYQILMEGNGLPVKSTNILPISTVYETGTQEDTNLEEFKKWWVKFRKRAGRVAEKGYVGLDQKIINTLSAYLDKSDKNQLRIVSKIVNPDLVLDPKSEEIYNLLMQVYQGTKYGSVTAGNLLNKNGTVTDIDTALDQSIREIDDTKSKTDDMLKNRGKFFNWAYKHLNKVMPYIVNNTLWAKYVSGSEDTFFSQIMDKELYQGLIDTARFVQGFHKRFKAKNNTYFDNSSYQNPNLDISQFETKTFDLDMNKNEGVSNSSVTLTKTEMLMIHLMNRQDDGRFELLTSGLKLDKIKGRNINYNNAYKFTEAQLNEISESIMNDKNAQEIIKEMDSALEYNHVEMNKIYQVMNGRELPMLPNYFPMLHGDTLKNIRKEKNLITNVNSLRARREMSGPLFIADPFQVMNTISEINGKYVGYAIPITNAEKILKGIGSKYASDDRISRYLSQLQGTLNKIQDGEALYSTQGEQDFSRWLNKIQGNFSVAVLGMNLGVVFKQQVSLVTAAGVIDNKFISKSGPGIFGINVINPFKLFKQLELSGYKDGETILPVEWKPMIEHPDYDELMKYAPDIAERLQGKVNRETGEAIMGRLDKSDKITIPFLKGPDGKPLRIDKNRVMQGITLMDSLTIMRLYNAVKLETESLRNTPEFANLTEEEIRTHNINRLRYVIRKTQPTFNIPDRTGLARNSDPLSKALTMFTSAVQKVSMQNTDHLIDYINNPTKENQMRLFGTAARNLVATSLMLSAIDVLYHGLVRGFDDDELERLPEQIAFGMLEDSLSLYPILGQVGKIAVSRMDSNPWYVTQQDPMSSLIQEIGNGTANTFKGNFGEAFKQLSNAGFKSVGIPITPLNQLKKIPDHQMFK